MGHHSTLNLPLKLAIVASRISQRHLALQTGIGEVRLSAIVNGHKVATADERRVLARTLRLTQRQLFPTLELKPELNADA